MNKLKFRKVSWNEYVKDCQILAKRLHDLKIDKIVAISRGGLVAARILSDLTTVSISHITISSYKELKHKKEIVIEETPSRSFRNETILLVDEICDTGKTFKRARSYFKNVNVKNIFTLTLYLKPHSTFTPDFWLKKTDVWVVFPYELMETYLSFKKIFKNDVRAKKQLLTIGFSKSEIAYI